MFYDEFYRQCPLGTAPYIYTEGETLYSIAQKFNTTVGAILAANPGINPTNLYGGLQICVPRQQPPLMASACPIGTSPYQIKSGDTFAGIARKFNTTVQAIVSANPGVNPNTLRIGQTICVAQIKPPPTTCATQNTYVVHQGETLYSIARSFNVTLGALTAANPTVSPNNIYPGMVLCIPLAPTPYSIIVSVQPKVLDLYRQGRFVKSYRVATGKPSTPTPKGSFTIINKQVDPGGPFGTRWMGLSIPHYGIHGTNRPESIGTAASNGCIRMNNRDVEDLFSIVTVGTVVRIL